MAGLRQAILLVALMCGLSPVTPVAAQQTDSETNAATKTTTDAGTDATQAMTWLRQKFQISGSGVQHVRLRMLTSGTTSVYVNGQRLARNLPTSDAAVEWNVGPLMRSGDNCVAVSIAQTPPAGLSILLVGADGSELARKSDGWKTAKEIPPAGWQQTDFNDRDWISMVFADSLKPEQLLAMKPTLLEWQVNRVSRSASEPFDFRDGDHVVLLGGTFFERAQSYGYLECALLSQSPVRKVTLRNLGWSADTVFAESRGIFDAPQKGYLRMIEHVRAEEPTVILVNYGQNEALSFADTSQGLERFTGQLSVLCDDLRTTGADVIFVSPHPFLETGSPLPNAARWNARLADVSNAVRKVASEKSVRYVDLQTDFLNSMRSVQTALHCATHPWSQDAAQHPELNNAWATVWSDNGMHWTQQGYACVGPVLAERLTGVAVQRPVVDIDEATMTIVGRGGEVREAQWSGTPRRLTQFQFRPATVSQFPLTVNLRTAMTTTRKLSATSTDTNGTQVSLLQCDVVEGERVSFMDQQNAAAEHLRQLTIRKNELYFHRWRPQNVTYLFGFRKHEQGNNAVEIAMFDPLIHELEEQILTARQPQWVTITFNAAE